MALDAALGRLGIKPGVCTSSTRPANPEMKVCIKCEQEFEKSFFYKDSRGKDGLFARCKACHNKASRKWQVNNKDKVNKAAKNYRDSHKEEISERYKDWDSRNKEYRRLYKKQYRQKTFQHRQDYRKLYYKNNRETELLNAHKRREKLHCACPQRWILSEQPEGLCYWCGVDLDTVKVHIEHVMPISLGGPANETNEVLACSKCNESKHDKHPLVWIAILVSEEECYVS